MRTMMLTRFWKGAAAGGVIALMVGLFLSRRAEVATSIAWRGTLRAALIQRLAVPRPDGSWSLQPWDDPALGGWTGIHAVADVRARGLHPMLLSDYSAVLGVTEADLARLAGTEAAPGVTYVALPREL